MIKVKVIEVDGQAAIVESDGERRIIPYNTVNKQRRCEQEVFDMGIPYGVDFKSVFDGMKATTSEELERELHSFGVWTVEDALANPAKVRQAIMAAHGTVLATVLNTIRALKR